MRNGLALDVPVMEEPFILVISQDPQDSSAMLATLQARRYEVINAPGTDQGLEQVRGHAPDLIILDLNLSSASTLDFCYQVREHTRAPIVVISSTESASDRV